MKKITFISKSSAYTHSTPLMAELKDNLKKFHYQIDHIIPEDHVLDLNSLQVDADCYILRPGIDLGMTIAAILHDLGANIINSFPASNMVQDKARAGYHLARNGIPTPLSFIAGNPRLAMFGFGLDKAIIKPHRGSYGEGIRILEKSHALEMEEVRGGVFGQQYLANSGYDLKTYAIGDRVFGLYRKFPARSYEEKLGTICHLDDEIKRWILKIGEIFGLEIYGVDIVETSNAAFVVDVNYFPGFIGITDAPRILADYLHNRVKSPGYKLEVV